MGRFLAKGVLFGISLAAILLGSEVLVTSMTPWRRFEDPRERILWDGAFDGTRLVLLGDSVFASLYVNRSVDTLWARLEAHTAQRVFPGALNGARLPDVAAAAVHVAQEWPRGTIVFIGVPPTRFVASRLEEPPTGNFADSFFSRYGIDANDASVSRRFQGLVYRWFVRPFAANRTRSALRNLVDRPRPPRWMRQRSWLTERATPRERFELFDQNLVIGAHSRPLGWLERMTYQLEGAGIRPVFVLTPLNEALVRSFASVHSSDAILRQVRQAINAVRTHLHERGAAVIDLTDAVPPECFFDLIHLNTCGDELTAARLAEWLTEDGEVPPTSSARLQGH